MGWWSKSWWLRVMVDAQETGWQTEVFNDKRANEQRVGHVGVGCRGRWRVRFIQSWQHQISPFPFRTTKRKRVL